MGSKVGNLNPDMDVIDSPGICPIRLDHCLIYGTDLDGARDLFTQVLGFTLVERALLGRAAQPVHPEDVFEIVTFVGGG